MPLRIRELFPDGTVTLAAAHDIGKISPEFQAQCPAWRAGRELMGATLLQADHAACTQCTLREHVPIKWAQIAGAHHGKIKTPNAGHKDWNDERKRLLSELVREFGSLPRGEASDGALFLVGGLISVADWIGSDERFFPQDVGPEDGSALFERAISALHSIGWRKIQPQPRAPFRHLFPEIPAPNSLQEAAADFISAPGLYVIEAPMGYGKTEAALAAAYSLIAAENATGLYFALPTQTTSNRIYLRVRSWISNALERGSPVRLAHGASWLIEDGYAPHPAPQPPDLNGSIPNWFASAKRALLTPIGVGTVDQALLGIVAVKHFFVRQFALAGKVVVLDEVHSYDLYTGTLITLLVRRLRQLGATVIVLSATLIQERKRELLELSSETQMNGAYPLLSAVDESGKLIQRSCEGPPSRTVLIRHFDSSPFEDAIQAARRGACVLWIRNTVDLAQKTLEALREQTQGSIELGLLHSRFPFCRREELEEQWMRALGNRDGARPNGCILVATQVAEQSVDIDADLLLTDLAPTDMLLQRLGRLWRHIRQNRPRQAPEVWIGMPRLEALGDHGKVYAPYVLARSWEQWRHRESIILPDGIRQVLEATYAPAREDEPEQWVAWRRELEDKKQDLQRAAVSGTLVWQSCFLDDVEGVSTRWSEVDSASIVLIREREGKRWTFLDGTQASVPKKWEIEAARAIHRNLVRVPGRLLSDSWSETLQPYVDGPAAAGIVEDDGSVRLLEGQANRPLVYDALRGIAYQDK
jgi:CRISPR-associated endonuclease/helicase Cas3